MPSIVEALEQRRFVTTTEEPPPKGTDVTSFFQRTSRLTGLVDGINLTEASRCSRDDVPVPDSYRD